MIRMGALESASCSLVAVVPIADTSREEPLPCGAPPLSGAYNKAEGTSEESCAQPSDVDQRHSPWLL